MKQIWTGRTAHIASRYAEHAPMAAACCNACRTCATTNLVGLAFAGLTATGVAAATVARRIMRRA